MPDDFSATRDASDDELAEWTIINAAEATIKDAVATTVRGVTIQLWVAFQHKITARADDEAAQAGNRQDTELTTAILCQNSRRKIRGRCR